MKIRILKISKLIITPVIQKNLACRPTIYHIKICLWYATYFKFWVR